MMTAAKITTPLDLDAISERELDKLKQKVERLGKFLRIRILRGPARGRSGSMELPLFAPRRVFHGQAAQHHHRWTGTGAFHSRTLTTNALGDGHRLSSSVPEQDGSAALQVASKKGTLRLRMR